MLLQLWLKDSLLGGTAGHEPGFLNSQLLSEVGSLSLDGSEQWVLDWKSRVHSQPCLVLCSNHSSDYLRLYNKESPEQ